MATPAEVIRLVYELTVIDKATKHLLASERQVQKETKQTTSAMKQQDAAVRKSASVAETASRREVRAAKQVSAARRRSSDPGLLRRGAAGVGSSARGVLGAAVGIASVSSARKAVDVTESLAKSTLTLHKSFGLVVEDASRWAAVSMARGADGKQLTMGFKALATAVRNARQGVGAQTEALDKLREKNALKIAQAEDDASRMKNQHDAQRKLTAVQETAARAEAELSKKTASSAKVFEELGITQQQLAKHGGDMNWVLRAVSDGLNRLPPGTDKAAISAKLFGRTWTTIAPLVRDGSKAMAEQLGMADKYGATMGIKTVADLQAHIKAEREAKLAILGLQIAFGTKVAPTLTKLIQKFSAFAAQMHAGTGAGGKFAKQAREIGDDLRPVATMLKATGKFLAQHPKLVVAAAAAYGAFRAARGAVKIVGDIRDIGTAIKRVEQRAAKSRIASSLASGVSGLSGRMGKVGTAAGRAAGKGFVAGFVLALPFIVWEFKDQINKAREWFEGTSIGNILTGKFLGGERLGHWLGEKLGTNRKKRAGGRVARMAVGGLVPLLASGGEMLVDRGQASVVPGDSRRDGTLMFARPGAAVLTADGQARMAGGASMAEAIASQAPHFAKGGVVSGKFLATAYGPPWGGIQGGGVTATGVNLRRGPKVYGVAVDPRVIPLGSQVYAWPNPFNRSGPFRAFDTGGAIKGNRLDFYDWRGRASQHKWGSRSVRVSGARIHAVGRGPSTAAQEDVTARVPLSLSPSRVRQGLVEDAVSQGIAAGASGLTRREIARAAAGGRGARRNPIMEAIAGAMTPSFREVTIPGKEAGIGGSGRIGSLPGGVTVPHASWNPAKRPIARWIVPYLSWAASASRGGGGGRGPARRGAGAGRWTGVVTSGYRSLAEQKRIWASGVRPAARPGSSNHEGASFPRGAVDVTKAPELAAVLASRPGKHLLKFAGAKDPVHFSYPHGGSYRRGGVVGNRHNATYYRRRFGDRYRGFYLWGQHGTGQLGRSLGSGQWYSALDDYFGSREGWVRQGGDDQIPYNDWRAKWNRGQRFRRGGVVGGRLGPALSGAMSFKGGSLDALDTVIGQAVNARLEELRREVLRRVRRGGDKRTVQRLQGVLDMIDFEIGRRIGRVQDVVERRTANLERGQAAVERGLRLAGVDAASPIGVAVMGRAQAAETGVRKQNVASLERALATARRTGNREVIRDVQDRLKEARDALAESLVRQVELWRDQLRALAEEATQRAQFELGLTQAGGSILEAWQRTAGVQDTAASMAQRATYTATRVLPMLEQQRQAALFAAQMAAATGDLSGWRAAVQDAASAAVEIANAQADAAELMRAAAMKAAQDVVDAATHTRTMQDLGLQRLELEQQLIGTFESTGGAMGRADFIKAQIIPAIQGEIQALQVQLAAAQATGDSALATQIAEAIYGKQNDVLQSQLDAMNAVKDNTDVLKEFGGALAFSYQGQVQTDLDVIRARAGA